VATSDNMGLIVWDRSAFMMASSTSRELLYICKLGHGPSPKDKNVGPQKWVGAYGPNHDPKTNDPF
jgi:hypothetical protein